MRHGQREEFREFRVVAGESHAGAANAVACVERDEQGTGEAL